MHCFIARQVLLFLLLHSLLEQICIFVAKRDLSPTCGFFGLWVFGPYDFRLDLCRVVAKNLGSGQRTWWLGCFSKTLFQTKIRAVPLRTPLGSIIYIKHIQKLFSVGQVQRVKPLSQKWRTFRMQIFTQPSPGQVESRLSENLHCKSPPFLTKWWDPLDLSQEKDLLGMVYICPIGSREGMTNFFF